MVFRPTTGDKFFRNGGDIADAVGFSQGDEACALLARNPRIGHKRPDLTDEPVLFWPVRGRYLVIYHRASQPLKIARILHAARDAEGEL